MYAVKNCRKQNLLRIKFQSKSHLNPCVIKCNQFRTNSRIFGKKNGKQLHFRIIYWPIHDVKHDS